MSGQAAHVTLLLNVAKALAESQMLLGCQYLVAEEQHLVAHPGSTQFGKQCLVREGLGDLDTADQGPEGAGHGAGREPAVAGAGDGDFLCQRFVHGNKPSKSRSGYQ